MNEVSTIERGSALANVESSDPVSFIAKLALDERIDEQKLRVLWDIQKDVLAEKRKEQAEAARVAYVVARSKMQQELPPIGKDKENKHDKYSYATLEHIWEKCVPVWTKHGFSVSYQSRSTENNLIRVSLQLYHECGHVEEFFAPDAPADNAGRGGTVNKTPIQANQSTVTYLKRGLLCSALGIVTYNEDDDGTGGGDRRNQSDRRPQNNGQMRDYVKSDEFNSQKEQPSQAQRELQAALAGSKKPVPETWISTVEHRIAEAPDGPSKLDVVGKAALEIKTEDDITSMRRSTPIKKLAEAPDNLTRIQAFLAAARLRISPQKPPPMTGQFDIHDIDGHHIDGPFLDPREFAERFSEFMGTVPVEDWTATLKVNEVDLIKAKKNDVAAKTLAKLESPA